MLVFYASMRRAHSALDDLAGEPFAMYSNVGFWDKVKQVKVTDAKFVRLVRQEDTDPISAIIAANDMPTFISDCTPFSSC